VAVTLRSWAVIVLSVFVLACSQSDGLFAATDQEPDKEGLGMCVVDADCQLARATCCECPSFALPRGDGKLEGCDGVDCPPPQAACPLIHAACDAGVCVVACEPATVTRSCAAGFAADAAGCLIDACASSAGECGGDGDCVRTRADCCGCAGGGGDTAVPAAQRTDYDAQLGCPASPQCPGVDVCVADEVPRCLQGACSLLADELPADACGRPDLPSCPPGTACVVNASAPADRHGVGVCRVP
jgi:hypothetical protein